MSKLRYGLQFLSQVRTSQADPVNQNMKSVQVAQNKMLRMLENELATLLEGVGYFYSSSVKILLKKYIFYGEKAVKLVFFNGQVDLGAQRRHGNGFITM